MPADVHAPVPARRVPELGAALVGAKLLDLALYVMLARWLSVEAFGALTFAVSFTLLFLVVADLGVATVFARDVAAHARDRASRVRLLCTALVLKLMLGVACVCATMGIGLAAGMPVDTIAMVSAVTGGMLLNSAAALFDVLLRIEGRPGAGGLAFFAQSAAAFAMAAGLLAAGLGPQAGALALLAGGIAHAAVSAWRSHDLWFPTGTDAAPWRTSIAEVSSMIRGGLPVVLPAVFIALYFRIDVVMLHVMDGETAVGFYAAACGLFEVLLPLSAAHRVVLVPVSHRGSDGPGEGMRVLARRSLRALLLLTVGMAAFITLDAGSVLDTLLGAAYRPAAPALAILIWALPAAFMADLLHQLLGTSRRRLAGTVAVAVIAGLNVLLNWLLIPALSFTGAAVATLASELLCFGLLVALFLRTAGSIGFAAAAWRPVVAGLMLATVLVTMGSELPPGLVRLGLAAIGGSAVYLMLLTASGAVRAQDAAARPEAAGKPDGRQAA